MFKDPIAPQTFKMAVNYASLNPNSTDAEFNRKNAASAKSALSGVAAVNSMLINYNKKPQDAKRDLKDQFNSEARHSAIKSESDQAFICEQFLGLMSPRQSSAKKGKKGKKG